MTDEEKWRDSMDGRMERIERRINAMDTADAVSAVHHKNVETRLSSIEGTLVWLVRLIIGGLLGGLIMFIIAGGIQT